MRIQAGGGISVIAASLAAVPMVVFGLGQPVAAADGNTSNRPSATSAGNISTMPSVTVEAWQSGQAAYGDEVTPGQAVAAYWTPQRMRSAKPIEESPTYRAAVEKYLRSQPDQGGEQSSNEPPHQVKPESHLVQPSRGGIAAGPERSAIDPRFDFRHPTARTSGKVFFTLTKVDYVCSATVINSEGQNTVWTAGHCVHGGKGSEWATNWQFVPAYDDDLAEPRPFGIWLGGQLWTRTDWANDSDISSDMGVAIMSPNATGSRIVAFLGGQGFRTSAGREVLINAFGYPAERPFDGGNLYQCQGTTSPEWANLITWSETLKVGCDMTRGSSGGGWLLDWDGSWGYLNGVNSRIDRVENPTIMMSPYFDDTAWSLYDATRNS